MIMMPDLRKKLALSACPVCLSSECVLISNKDGKTGQDLTTVACTRCGVGRIDPMPTEESLSRWYRDQYRQEYKGAVSPQKRHVLRAACIAVERWQWLSRHAKFTSSPTSLDIGASSGEFVYLMHKLGFVAQGIEPHLGYSAHAREVLGLNVKTGTLQEAMQHVEAESQSLVSMFHVFEHVANPVHVLHLVHNLLVSEGYFLLELPDATAPSAPHTMFFKAHTLYFSRLSLIQLLQAIGFRIVADTHRGEENLLVLAQKVRAQPKSIDNEMTWVNDQAIVQAQHNRRWLPYLFDQLIHAHPLRKIKRRQEEKKQASAYASSKEILDAVYVDCQRIF